MSRLLVNKLRVRARVGCKESERAHPQMLRFDLRLDYDMTEAIASDDVAKAIDYKDVAARVRELLAGQQWHLIETLAHDIALNLRTLNDKIRRVEVTVTKDIIADAESVAALVAVDF